jgi:hypothetical protein
MLKSLGIHDVICEEHFPVDQIKTINCVTDNSGNVLYSASNIIIDTDIFTFGTIDITITLNTYLIFFVLNTFYFLNTLNTFTNILFKFYKYYFYFN